jgi:hypothetical protein
LWPIVVISVAMVEYTNHHIYELLEIIFSLYDQCTIRRLAGGAEESVQNFAA